MSCRDLINRLLNSPVPSSVDTEGTKKHYINQGCSLSSLGSPTQIYNLEKLSPPDSEDLILNDDELEYKSDDELFNDFLNKVKLAGLELLERDISWIRSLCYTHRVTEELFDEYIKHWLDAMDDNEKIEVRKQNKGRFAANTFIRGTLNGI
jgi:hypothetical protein